MEIQPVNTEFTLGVGRATRTIDINEIPQNVGTEWLRKARCGQSGESFEGSKTREEQGWLIAKYCLPCPVIDECLGSALSQNMDGICGGATKPQRDKIKRRMKTTCAA